MPLWKWTDRVFSFDFPPEKMPDLLERLRGAPVRISAMTENLPASVLTGSDGKGWTIQQNIGHLTDTEYLPLSRINQISAGEEMLVAADMSNAATHQSNHNSKAIQEIVGEFEKERNRLVDSLERVDKRDWGKSAIHPRLNQPMRIVDIAYFTSEHDDYHIARIREIIQALA